MKHINAQRSGSDDLRQELEGASHNILQSNVSTATQIQGVLDEERKRATEERQKLLEQITLLINSQAELQETRLADKTALIRRSLLESNQSFEGSVTQYSGGMATLNAKENQLLEDVGKSRDALKSKLKEDWTVSRIGYEHLIPIFSY